MPVITTINCELFPKPKLAELQEHALDADNEDDTDWSTFPLGAQDYNLVKASPYEWCVCNDAWLQAVMYTSMNDSTVLGIPTINHVKHLVHPDPLAWISPIPTCTYAVKYDAHIKVTKDNDPVSQTQNALMLFFQKIKSVDPLAVIYPWEEKDYCQQIPAITKPEELPGILSNLWVYANWLYISSEGGTSHPHIFSDSWNLLLKFCQHWLVVESDISWGHCLFGVVTLFGRWIW